MADDTSRELSVQNKLRELVAEEVRALLGRRRMNGAKLAAEIGRSEMYVSRRLRGETAFDLDDLEKIAAALGVEVVDLLPARDAAHTLRNFETASDLPERPTPRPDGQPERPRRNPRRHATRPASAPPAGTPDEHTRRPALIRRAHSV